MEHNFFDEPREVVLTYRQEEPEPIELRYERELPERMREKGEDPFAAHASSAWRSAVAPAERGKKRPWATRLFVGLSLLVALVCLGVGIFLFQESRADSNHSGGTGETEPPDGGEYYYWNEDAVADEETTIHTYRPYGGDIPQLELVSVEEGAPALTAGEVYEKLLPSTVTVLGYQSTSYSVGTGIIFTSDGYLLTNYHVIAGSNACEVWVADQYGVDASYKALLVGGDADQDLAVLKIDAEGLTPAEFGVSDDLSVGDNVYAMGNPLGLELRNTFTDGIVSAVNRDVDVDGFTMTLIQTNAALNSGNSGGPLVNEYGQVVGINTIKMMSGYDNTIEGLGFAIPTSLAVRWVNEIIQTGGIEPQPVLGLSISRIPETLPDGTTGLQVMSVTQGLGADKAGIRVGDYVVAFAGEDVFSTEDILKLRRSFHVGDLVSIRIYRNGEYLDLTMEMMKDNTTGQQAASGSEEAPELNPR